MLALLSGCVSIPSAGISSENKNLPTDGGLVAVQVVTNATRLSDHLANWSEVIVAQEGVTGDDGKPLLTSIPALIDGLSTTRVFVGLLKPGRYRFGGLYSIQTGEFIHVMTAPAPRTVGSFEVKTGHLTNLGTVLFQPFLPDPLATTILNTDEHTRYAMSRIDDAESLTDFVSHRYPKEHSRTLANPVLGWLPDQLAEAREKLASATRAYALLALPHNLGKPSEITYTARLGTIYRRHADGAWSTCHVPTNYELLSYDELADGSVLTGSERGHVWRSSTACGDWRAVPLPDPVQSVIWLGHSAGAQYALTAEQRRYRIYATTSTESGWRLVKEFGTYSPLDPQYLVDHIETPAMVIQQGDTLAMYTYSGTYRFRTDTEEFTTMSSDGLSWLSAQPNRLLVSSESSSWIGNKPPRVSLDGGKTWLQYQRLGAWGSIPYVLPNGDEIAADSSATYVFFGWKKNAKIDVLRSQDRGKTNTRVGDLPYGCGTLDASVSQDDFFVARCFDGSLLHSLDQGRTWTVEFDRAVRAGAIPPEFLGTAPSPSPK